MSNISSRSSATFLSEEGVFFETRPSFSNNTFQPQLARRWSRTAESQTSICLVHVEVMATRGGLHQKSHRGLLSLLDQVRSIWVRKQHLDYNWWGWHQADPGSQLEVKSEPVNEGDTAAKEESDEEADLSGWDQCGVSYGNGVYNDDDDEED